MLGSNFTLVISAHPASKTAACPTCGSASARIHSTYQRSLVDLPSHGQIGDAAGQAPHQGRVRDRSEVVASPRPPPPAAVFHPDRRHARRSAGCLARFPADGAECAAWGVFFIGLVRTTPKQRDMAAISAVIWQAGMIVDGRLGKQDWIAGTGLPWPISPSPCMRIAGSCSTCRGGWNRRTCGRGMSGCWRCRPTRTHCSAPPT